MRESKFNHIKIGNFVDTESHMAWLLHQVADCVRKSNDSRSAIRIAYRSSLRSSSVREPRYPPLKIFFFLFLKFTALPCESASRIIGINDPSAGSPTETLLRLILPLSDMAYTTFRALMGQSEAFAESLNR